MKNYEESNNGCNAKRNVGVELFRCLLMFSICIRHSIYLSGYGEWWEANIFTFGVVGFALITGWFGVSFKPSKIIKLWGLAAVCVLLPATVVAIYCQTISFVLEYRRYLLSNWYLNAYTVILLLSPFINDGLQKMTWRGGVGIIILCIWSWMSEMGVTKALMPRLLGIGDKSAFVLLYAYVFGFTVRKYNIFVDWKHRWRILLCLSLLPMLALAGANTSPFTILFASLLLVEFSKIDIPNCIGRVVLFIAPSMFSVYLIHTNFGGLTLLLKLISRGIDFGLTRWGAFLLASTIIMMICVCVDLVRRGLYFNRLKRMIDSALRRADEKFAGYYRTSV